MTDKKTIHIQKELHKAIEIYKSLNDIPTMEEAVESLIIEGFETKEELPDLIMEMLDKIKEED